MESGRSGETPNPADGRATPATDLRDVLQMFDELPTGILLTDPDGTVLRVNPVAAARLSEKAAEVLGRNLFSEVLPTLQQEGIGDSYRGQIAIGRVHLECEAKLATPSGIRSLWLGLRSFPFKGSTWGVVLLEDRSLLAEEEERRKRAESLASVGELAAGVAHEVNSPARSPAPSSAAPWRSSSRRAPASPAWSRTSSPSPGSRG
jgi:nitrogen-specific signal transduction histidine kinase